MWARRVLDLIIKLSLQSLSRSRNREQSNPFYGEVDALRRAHWVKPELVAEVKFYEWTHETPEGGMKLRAPVFLGLRNDKKPEECTFQEQE